MAGLGQHPDVFAASAALRGDHVNGGIRSDSCQASGHDPMSGRAGGGVHANGYGLCRETQCAVRAPDRGLRQGQVLLRHVGVGSGPQSLDEPGARFARQRAAKHRLEALVRPGGLDHEPVEMG